MLGQVQQLLESYHLWLKDRTTLRSIGEDQEWVEITTPFLDRNNDCLQIYARQEGSSLLLTDDGEVIGDLRDSGCDLSGKKRQELLKMTLNGFGVHQEGDQLVVRASRENFPMKKHALLQAMIAVNDLFYLASTTVRSLFAEDVGLWLDENEVRYLPYTKFTGKSGYDHIFDFAVPKSKRQPERLIRAINKPTSEAAKSLILAWTDTKETRPEDAVAYAFLNDQGRDVPASVVDALKSYEIKPVLWQEREKVKEELVA